MQYRFRTLTLKLRLTQLRKFRGRQSARSAGDGETPVASVKCLMSLSGHLLRAVGICPLCFSSIGFIVIMCLLKSKYLSPAHNSKVTRLSHSVQYCRYQTYSDSQKSSFFPTIPRFKSFSFYGHSLFFKI